MIQATAKVEGRNPDSMFAKTQADRLHEIRNEGVTKDGTLDVRGAIANAFLVHGDSFEVDAGPVRVDSTDEIIDIVEGDDNA